MNEEEAPKVAEAVGTAASAAEGISAREVEEAMTQAVVDANKEGITDPGEIRKRKLAARQAVKDKYAPPVAKPKK